MQAELEQTKPVLIVGAGPAGLALALALLKNGIPVRLIEKDPAHHHGIRGPGITPRTLEIEHFMGVDEVQATGMPSLYIHSFDPEDPYRIASSVDILQEQAPAVGRPIRASLGVSQWKHQEILREHIARLGGHVELGTSLVGIEQQQEQDHDAHAVTATLAKYKVGSDVPELETAAFSYLVGADGGKSAVRRLLGLQMRGETRKGEMYLVDGSIEGLQYIHKGHMETFMWGSMETAWFVARSTEEDGIFAMIFGGPDVHSEGLSEAGNVDAVQKELNRISERDDIRVTGITWQGTWRPNLRIASAFRSGRAFIVGDAAHTHSPAGGQGLNTSVQDSYNLAWKLALVLKHHCPASLLDTYEQERLPVVAEMLDMTTKISDTSLSRTRSKDLHQLDVNYRWSPIVVDDRISDAERERAQAEKSAYGKELQKVQAGDRAPDAPSLVARYARQGLPAVTRLFDIFKPDIHVTLIFATSTSTSASESGGALEEMLRALDAIPACRRVVISPRTEQEQAVVAVPQNLREAVDYVFDDSEGHAWKVYGVEDTDDTAQPVVVIVRPDAMVGAWVRSVEGINSYARTLGFAGLPEH